MKEHYKKDYNAVVHETDDEIIFTTNNKVAAELLSHIVDDANITESDVEYHFQGWIKKKSNSSSDSKKKKK